jgi:hypothetical protein
MRAYTFAIFAVAMLLGTSMLADGLKETATSPGVRVFSSSNGRWSSKVSAARENWQHLPAKATLLAWNPDGSEKVIWQRQLINIPQRVIVYDGPPDSRDSFNSTYVVTIGSWGENDDEHTVVVYGYDGKIIRDLSLKHVVKDVFSEEELKKVGPVRLSEQEIRFIVPRRVESPTHLYSAYGFPQLEITLKSGKKILLEVAVWGDPTAERE